jgi:hypothetical protein
MFFLSNFPSCLRIKSMVLNNNTNNVIIYYNIIIYSNNNNNNNNNNNKIKLNEKMVTQTNEKNYTNKNKCT